MIYKAEGSNSLCFIISDLNTFFSDYITKGKESIIILKQARFKSYLCYSHLAIVFYVFFYLSAINSEATIGLFDIKWDLTHLTRFKLVVTMQLVK